MSRPAGMRCCALLLLACAAAHGAETPPAPAAPKDFRLPAKFTRTLPNGLQLTFIEFGTLPKVTLSAILRVGNLNEGEQTWIADVTGELLKEGAGKRDGAQIAEAAANMGGEVSVSVASDQTSVSLDVLTEHGADAVALLGDLLRHPTFPESELARIKRDLDRQLALSRSEPSSLAGEAFAALLYPGHPYGHIYPSAAQLAAYTLADVQSFYTQNFGAARTHLYVAGHFDRAALETAIEHAFGDWSAGPAPLLKPAQGSSKLQVKLIDRPMAPQSTILLGLPVVDPSNPDYMRVSLMNTLLGGAFASRITANIREAKGYAYSPSSGITSRYRAAYWVEQADVTTDATGPALQEIYGEIERLSREPPSAAELDGIKNYRAGVFVMQNATRSALISQLAFIDLHGLPDDYLTRFVERVYAFTPEQISAAAREYIRPEHMTLVIVGDLAKIRAQLAVLPQLKGVKLD